MAPSSAAASLLLLLVLPMVLSNEVKEQRPKTLRRMKREWILPAAKLMENVDYTQKPYIAKIRSDKDRQTKVEYYITGPGANKPPINLFVVDHDTGFVRITDIVDREKYPFFNLTGVAKYVDGTAAEADIPLTITILDMNDNTPHFELHSGNISEASKEGTFVMQIEGRDDDQLGTLNSQISYSIISQEPEGIGHMFRIDEKTGKLFVKESSLDRETIDFYRLVIQGVDLGGAAGGLTGSGTVEIRILDINDNIPTLAQPEYTSSVDENVHDVVVTKIKALDLDLEHSDNWRVVFGISKGNEDNLFTIETDENTNEGILKLIKPVDFEEVQNLELSLLIKNVAPFVKGDAVVMDVGVKVGESEPLVPGGGTGGGPSVEVGLHIEANAGVEGPGGDLNAGVHPEANLNGDINAGGDSSETETNTKSYPIKIAVNNVPEDPAFMPYFKELPVSEDPNDQPENGIITVFPAVDPDTGKPADNVRYAKASDPDNWFTIDEDTAEIKLNKKPDRESPFVVNGSYVAKIVAISKDDPSATATGTIGIKITDSNDHCPTLTSTQSSLCADEKTVYITAVDEDASPNAAPFTFRIIPMGSQGSWDMESFNDTTAALHSRENLWPGVYELQVMVTDAQGLSCLADEMFTLHVCTCVDSEICHFGADRRATSSLELSAAAISLLLLALALLLFIPLLLLFCQCGGAKTIFPDQFTELPFEAKEHLISYHIEGKGKDQEVPLKSIPVMLTSEMGLAPNFKKVPFKINETYKTSTFYKDSMESKFKETQEILHRFSDKSLRHGNTLGRIQMLDIQVTPTLLEDMALPDPFLKDYYTQRAEWTMPVKDGLLEFNFEGQCSSAGSVTCCSLLDSQEDLQFLNDLGIKFKTLAEVCSPPEKTLPSTPRPSTPPITTLTHDVADTVGTSDHVDKIVGTRLEPVVETTQLDERAEKLISSYIISKSSDSKIKSSSPLIKLPHTKATTNSHSSNICKAAALLSQSQTVLIQQQPFYYTNSSVLQPVQYVVQPQLQNMVLLTDKTFRANHSGLFVVHGSKNPPVQGSASGIVVQGIDEKIKTPKSSESNQP